MDYTKDELLAGVQLASEEGNIEVANELAAVVRQRFPEVFEEPTAEVEEEIDQSEDFVDSISDADEIEAEENGQFEDEDEDGMEDEADEGDIEDKVDDLEAELEDLRAEFEKLLGDDAEEGEDDAEELDLEEPMDMDMDMEPEMEETVDYDIEESSEEEGEVVEEATKLSDAVAEPKGGEADSNESSLTKAPKKEAIAGASPVKSKDGGEGNKGDSAKDHTPTDNINVDHKKV